MARLPALPAEISQVCRCLTRTNALAYSTGLLISAAKKTVYAADSMLQSSLNPALACAIKLFTAVILAIS